MNNINLTSIYYRTIQIKLHTPNIEMYLKIPEQILLEKLMDII